MKTNHNLAAQELALLVTKVTADRSEYNPSPLTTRSEDMVDFKGRGTIEPASNFNVENVVSRLRKAMKGIGTDEKVIIDIFSGHTNAQRQIIKKKYKTIYGRILIDDIRSELGGHFEEVCLALLSPLAEYIVDCLYFSIRGFSPDENCILEMIITLESMDLFYVKTIFKEKYSCDLSEYLCSVLKGDFKRLVWKLTTVDRDFFVDIDENLAETDAKQLFTGSLSKDWRNEDNFFLTILSRRSKKQLLATVDAYEKLAGHPIEIDIKAEFGGVAKKSILGIVCCVRSRCGYLASQLHAALSGPRTDDMSLIRILVSRSEVDLADIQEWYHMKYDVDLIEAIFADTSGDYRKILLKLLNP